MNSKQAKANKETPAPVAEIDFSKGIRGKFYRAGVKFILPVHLEAEVANDLTRSAEQEGVDVTAFVAKLLEEHRLATRDSAALPRSRA